MKNNLLLSAFLLVTAVSSAQLTVWEDNFNDANASDWTLIDQDGNGSNWLTRKNIQIDNGGQIVDGTIDVLGSYHIDMASGAPLDGEENNWAISPSIDLSFYTAPIELIINFQTAIYSGDNDLYVYLSDSPEMESFLQTEPHLISFDRVSEDGTEFADFTVDISGYVGQEHVYVAMVTKQLGTGMEVNELRITADDIVSGTGEFANTAASIITQNPVKENLYIRLGGAYTADNTTLTIYNANGALVKEIKYNEAGINVEDLAAGFYFAALSDGQTDGRIKFIKQ